MPNTWARFREAIFGRGSHSLAELEREKLPHYFLYITLAVSILPFLLNLLGIDFGSDNISFDPHTSSEKMGDHQFQTFAGAFSHTILEWSAYSVAVLTAIMAFTSYSINKNPAFPIVGIALLCAGSMDAFHTLAATRLIDAAAPNQDLIPFTWALCRLFNSLICLLGIGIFIFRKPQLPNSKSLLFIVVTALVFIGISYVTIHICAVSESLPRTQFPDAIVTRPWDLYPFFVFLITAVVYKIFFIKNPSPFVYSLLISLIPNIAVQLHMAFGSSALFDNHFNIAHFLKIIAYLVPLAGLAYGYVRIYRSSEEFAEELKHRNKELDDFTYIASHDMKEPLRGIRSNLRFMLEDHGETMNTDMKNRMDRIVSLSERMEGLISALLHYSKLDRSTLSMQQVELKKLIEDSIENLYARVEEEKVEVNVMGNFPKIKCDPVRVTEIFTNLISNAIKYNDSAKKMVEIGMQISMTSPQSPMRRGRTEKVYYVKDNGIGVPPNQFEGVFRIFKRVHTENENIRGTGAGLTIVKKIVEQHGGKIWLESEENYGTTFFFTLEERR